VNPATALAATLVDELARCGVAEAVLAPGSRSTPLALALDDAERAGRLRLHVRHDERSAAFLALGLARASARPVPVVCTSGSAAANFHPAVTEAAESGVPLLLLTADRPPELRATAANQAIDQIKMYGSAVRWFCEVGVPEERAGMAAYWRSTACRAVAYATGADPGPVHLNLAFREPLVPDGDTTWPESLDGRAGGAPWTTVAAAEAAPPALPGAPRGVLVVGDTTVDPAPFVAHAQAHGWPVLSEPSGNARSGPNAISAYHHVLSVPEFAERHRPDVVVTVGRPGLSKPLLGYLATAGDHIVVSATERWPDPTRTATRAHRYAEPWRPTEPDTAADGAPGPWLAGWRAAEDAARAAIDAVLDGPAAPPEPRLARDLAAALPDGSLLFTGSSQPVRDLDLAMAPRTGLRVLANRGTSGIDGTVSAASGAALAHQAAGGGPAYALIGDLTALHDQNGLIIGPGEAVPDLTLVVVNNDGGGIFSSLPQAALPGPFERLFGTPHGVDLAAVAAATGTPYALVGDGELPGLLKGEGLRVVEVRTSRAETGRARLADAAARAVRAAL
jgi:2-succinyl-5-enolpyruvyl-6-hydroxy-3-cyclohexene-1-carboxylate synthase